MNPHSAQIDFENFVRQSGASTPALTLGDGFTLMFEFYTQIRAENCPIEDNGDMLLYQWGTYDWGEGQYFECSLTRQFIEAGHEGDDGMSQLLLCFYYLPTAEFKELQAGDHWCNSPNELSDFQAYITRSAAFRTALMATPEKVEIYYSKI